MAGCQTSHGTSMVKTDVKATTQAWGSGLGPRLVNKRPGTREYPIRDLSSIDDERNHPVAGEVRMCLFNSSQN